MKNVLMAGALVLAALGLAGMAGAACVFDGGPLGLADEDYLTLCAVEERNIGSPPYFAYHQLDLVRADYFAYSESPEEWTGVGLFVTQFQGQECWSCGGDPSLWQGTSFAAYAEHYDEDTGPTDAGVRVGQRSEGPEGSDWRWTYVLVYADAAGDYAAFVYGQHDYSGACTHGGGIHHAGAYSEVIPYGACPVAAPEIPPLPPL